MFIQDFGLITLCFNFDMDMYLLYIYWKERKGNTLTFVSYWTKTSTNKYFNFVYFFSLVLFLKEEKRKESWICLYHFAPVHA